VSYPLPPDTRAVGTGNPPDDMNKVIDALLGMGEAAYVKASGDTTGATDTAAVAAAEATARTVFFGPGTYWGNFTKQTAVHWQGSGRSATILKAPAASNAPVLTSAGFAAATLTGSNTAGITTFAIRDMTFDGNAGNQSVPAAFGVGIYGCDYLLDNVSVRNCLAADGLYTEYGPGNNTSFPDGSMESVFRFVRVHGNTCSGADWHFRGPHDSAILGCWIYNSSTTSTYGFWTESPFATYTATGLSGTAVSSTPATITLNSTISLPSAGTATMPSAGGTVTLTWTGTTATTLTGVTTAGGSGNYSSNTVTPVCAYSGTAAAVHGMHVWGNHTIAIVADASTFFTACQAEGSSAGQLLIRSGSQWNGGRVFSGGASNSYGIQLGDTANAATGSMLSWPKIDSFTGGVSTKAYLNVVNEAQGTHRALIALTSTNQAVYGTFGTGTHRHLIFQGGGSVTPAVAYASGAGTSPPASAAVANATDLRGQASWGTGTATTAGAQVTVTFAQPKPGTPAIAIWPENAATAALLPYVTNFGVSSFQVATQIAPAISQAAGTFQVGYADVTG
jgi:hypothetical protein